MTADEAAEMHRLLRENEALRQHFGWQPRTSVPAPPAFRVDGWWVYLTGYQVLNLRSVLAAVMTAPPGNPLTALNSGDWVSEVRYVLDPIFVVGYPLGSPKAYQDAAERRHG